MQETKDQNIWEKFKKGDKSALSYIYFQHFHPMFQYGLKLKNDSDFIKDCIQEVFFTLIKNGSNLGPTNNIRFYLLKALKNKIIRELNSKHPTEMLNDFQGDFDSKFVFESDLEQIEIVKERGEELRQALKGLSSKQREIIYLRYECNLGYSAICEIMQIQIEYARKLTYRAIVKLKKIIQSGEKGSGIILLSFLKSKRVL